MFILGAGSALDWCLSVRLCLLEVYHLVQAAIDGFHLDSLGLDHLLGDQMSLRHMLHKVRWLLYLLMVARRLPATQLPRWRLLWGIALGQILLAGHRVIVLGHNCSTSLVMLFLSDQSLSF